MVDVRCGSENRKHFDRHARPTVSLIFVVVVVLLLCVQVACLLTHGEELFEGHEMPFLHHYVPEFAKENWPGYCSWQCKNTCCWPLVYRDFFLASVKVTVAEKSQANRKITPQDRKEKCRSLGF